MTSSYEMDFKCSSAYVPISCQANPLHEGTASPGPFGDIECSNLLDANNNLVSLPKINKNIELAETDNSCLNEFANTITSLETRLGLDKHCNSLIQMPSSILKGSSCFLNEIGYRQQTLSVQEFRSSQWNELILISYQAYWEDRIISDSFLWPLQNRSVHDMKIFALNFLVEHLGKDLDKYENHQTECFVNHIAFLIQRELDINHNRLDLTNLLINSKYCNFSPSQISLGPQLNNDSQGSEHLIQIFLDITWENFRFQDKFLWDISNPDNSPEEFAALLTAEQNLPPIYNSLIALTIRRQISNYCLKCAQYFKEGADKEDFKMPITTIQIKSQENKSTKKILPLKRTYEEAQQEENQDILATIEEALCEPMYQPKSNSAHQTPNKSNFNKKQKIASNIESFKNKSNCTSLSDQQVRNQQREKSIVITLSKNEYGQYSFVSIDTIHNSQSANQIIKINLDQQQSAIEKLSPSSNPTIIKIPATSGVIQNQSKDYGPCREQLQTNDYSNSKITLDFNPQSPQIKSKMHEGNSSKQNSNKKLNGPVYSHKNHLIQIDLKAGFSTNSNSTGYPINSEQAEYSSESTNKSPNNYTVATNLQSEKQHQSLNAFQNFHQYANEDKSMNLNNYHEEFISNGSNKLK